MFCPRCGSTQNDELKFCKACGANLLAVRQAVDNREPAEKVDWGKNWVAEVVQTQSESKRRKEEIDRQRGLTPEVKLRYDEIKAGVITGSVGIAIAIFLYVFMQGIILSGNVTPSTAEILSRLWIAGVLPLFVGIALTINGLVVSKRLVEISSQNLPTGRNSLQGEQNPQSLGPADTNEFIGSEFSVTDQTTRHLTSPRPKQS